MNLDPWSYAAKTRSEHAEQVALFMWSNMAMHYGPNIANDPHSYNVKDFALKQFEGKGGLGYIRYSAPISQLKWLHAISNHGAGFGRAAEGVKAGVADLFLPVSRIKPWSDYEEEFYHGLYIELKRQDSEGKKAGTVSDKQLEFQTDMRQAGYAHEICYGWETARDVILKYLGIGLCAIAMNA